MNTHLTPFHLAIPVRDIAEAREFYGNKLGFPEGRSAEKWIDFNCFGHQLVTHLDSSLAKSKKVNRISNLVDNEKVPIPHFGVVLEMQQWQSFCEKLQSFDCEFIIKPTIRFKGQAGEQAIVFFSDPSGNALEFKAFKNIDKRLFATE